MNVQKVGIIITIILITNYLGVFNSKEENVGEGPTPLQVSGQYFLTLVFHV